MQLIKQVIGVDVAKDTLECAAGVIDTEQNEQIESLSGHHNTPSGFARLEEAIKRHRIRLVQLHGPEAESTPLWVVMEASGVYYERLALHLYHHGYDVAVVLPNKIKSHMGSDNQKSKTDRLDARAIVRYGLEKRLTAWEPPTPLIDELKSLTRERETLQDQLTEIRSREHAYTRAASTPKQVMRRVRQQRDLLKKQLKQIEAEIRKLLESDPDVKHRAECASSAAGVGILTVATIVAETGAFHLVSKPGQLASYSGLDPMLRESGTLQGKVMISHKGNSHLRRVLYMPALSAIRSNPQLKALYCRICERSGVKMKALVAVMRKLLELVYTLWRKAERYDPTRHLAAASI